jgi:hypothetical protein
MSVKLDKDVLTLDNLLHTLVAVAFVWAVGAALHFIGASVSFGVALALAGLAGIGLYLREASQVDWDLTLKFSLHKHLEWAVGTVGALIQAPVIALVW